MELRVSLLGPFAARLGDEPLADFRNRKTQALLIYLLVEATLDGRRREHQREQLMELLWPGLPQQSAQVNLRQTLYQLRQLAPAVNASNGGEPVPLLLSDRQTVWLHPEAAFELDVAAFLKGTKSEAGAEAQSQAAALYRGDFLSDFYLPDSETFEAWAAARRAEFRRLALDTLARLADHHLQRFEYAAAERYARRQLALDNLRESAHRQLMAALAYSGQRSAALAQYDACRDLLRRELGVEPAAETEALYQAIRRGEVGKSEGAGRIRGYELKEKVGEGSYGAVYRAYQPAVDRDVAIKVIRPEYANDPDFIRRFEAEAQMVARLEHPRIVPLYDYWREPGGAYLVMRWLRGGSLKEALTDGPWPVARALPLVEQVAAALHLAHHHGVVHRDLKPANILLDEAGNAYLGNFGIARRLADVSLQSDGFTGSPAYVSPEQLLSERVTPQSDIYTFGVVVYELLAGERPFAGESLAAILHKHLHEPLPSLQARRPELPPAVDEVIQRATAKKAAERYPDALAFAAALRQALAAEELYLEPGLALREIANPYKGLRAFEEADAPLFFGRESLVAHLLTRLADEDAEIVTPSPAHPLTPSPAHPLTPSSSRRFLALVGPSGSGKSSVVKAGLIPALRQGELPGSEKWFIVEMMPGARPLEELEAALLRVAVNPPATLLTQLREDERGLLRAVKRVLPAGAAGEDGSELLLVIDQFEELFTLPEDQQAARHFLDSLVAAVADPRSRIRVVATLRADFYDRPLLIPGFGELMQQYTEVVLPLTAEELSRAIREPARRVGVAVEDALLAEMVADVHEQPGALPLLQFALTELFEQRQGNRLTPAAYHAIGGVKGALGRRAEQLYQSLDEAGQEAVRQIFLRLVTLGEGIEDTRRRVLRSELESLAGVLHPSSFILHPLDVFGRYRLLSFDRDPATRGPTVEVAHEALLREWPRLRRWLEESRDDVRLQRRLAALAQEWQTAGPDHLSFLLRGSRLDQLAGWATSSNLALTQEEQDFLDASLAARRARRAEEGLRRQRELETARQLAQTEKARAEEQALAAQRLRRRAAFLAGALIIAAILAVLAFTASQASSRNAVAALANAELATTREAEAVANAALAATRETEAITSANLAADRQAEAEAETNARATAEADAVQQARVATSRELSLAAINNLTEDPELSILLTLQALETTYTKEAEEALHQAVQTSRVRLSLIGHMDVVSAIAYSPNGARVATASWDDTVKLWDATTGQELRTFFDNDEWAGPVAFNPSGDYLATGGDDGTIRVWQVANGEMVRDWIGHSQWISAVDFSPDGTRLATASDDGTAKLWAAETGEELFALDVPTIGFGTGVVFSPDGRLLATGGANEGGYVLSLWNAASGEALQHVDGFSDPLAFSPDGTQLAATTEGGGTENVIVWDVDALLVDGPGTALFTICCHSGLITSVAFSPDGTRLVTASQDGTAIIWDTISGQQLLTLSGHSQQLNDAAFSPDGKYVATASYDSTARVWDVSPAGTSEQLALAAHTDTAEAVIFSPDGRLMITGGWDGKVIVWEFPSGKMLQTLTGHNGRVYGVAISPDGQSLATASGDNTAKVWNLTNGQEILTFSGHADAPPVGGIHPGLLNVAYSPDGRLLATAGADGFARVWEAKSGQELLNLDVHPSDNGAINVTFSPDGTRLATTSDEPVPFVKIWDAASGQELLTLGGHTLRIFALAFSPDGKRLVTGDQGGIIKVWDAASGEELFQIPGHNSVVIYSAVFSPDGRYLATTGGGDGTVKIWDTATNEAVLAFVSSSFAGKVAFSPDGSYLAMVGRDGTVRVYILPLEEIVALGRSRVTRSLTTEECQQYLHVEACPGVSKQ